MMLSALEGALLRELLLYRELNPIRSTLDVGRVVVLDRGFSGAGFLTELQRSDELKLFGDGHSQIWGDIGARLNEDRLETGYLFYIENGYVTAIEGYTYGE